MQSLFLFSQRDSFLHRLDPRVKFFGVLIILMHVLIFDQALFIIPIIIVIILLLWTIGKISPLEYWPILLTFIPLVFALTLIQGATRSGANAIIVLSLGPISFSDTGLYFGLTIGLRLITMGIAFITFAMTTTPRKIGLGLHKVGIPFKYAYLGTFGLRFLPLIKGNLDTLQNARAVRGDPDAGSANIFITAKSLPKSLFPLMANSFRQSGEIANALELRGYGRTEKRTTINDIAMRYIDYLVLIMFIVLGILSIYVRYIMGIGF